LVKGGALVIDSRANISEGVIEGAMNITFSANFATFVGTLIKPDTKIVIVADAGSA
jgi:hydroxyacylglutathione hydrolase